MKYISSFIFAMMFMAATLSNAAYNIYPVPHSQVMGTATLALSATINVRYDNQIDESTVNRAKSLLEETGMTVTLNKDAENGVTQLLLSTVISNESVAGEINSNFAPDANKILKSSKYDRHCLIINEKGIAIMGENTNAVFFGLASLEQILEQKNNDGTLTSTTIYDYADQKNRGLVEGYYGYPYSVSVKKDLMHFMMRYKMNTYLYGAKSDPYHSQYWQTPYPASITAEQEKNGWLSQNMVKDLAKTSSETKVNFIWAIHPGNNFLGSSTVVNDIMTKYTSMYNLGVRQFAVFVDDVSIPSTTSDMALNATRLTDLQKAIESKWNAEGSVASDTVRPLHFVPQIYCSSFASSTEQRQNFMKALGKTPSYITVYTTGQGVWSVPNSGHMQNMNSELGRDMAWWWNYPCNDNADGQIYTMDMYSNFYDLPSVDGNATMQTNLTNTVGLVANPMQEGEVAKTALFSVADYVWNNSGFNNEKSWEASFTHLISTSDVREAYRFLTRYLRWNEPSSVKTLVNNYKTSLSGGMPNSTELRSLLSQIISNCELVETLQSSTVESDRLLYSDLRPWLLKLKFDCKTITQLLDVAETSGTGEDRWTEFLKGLDEYNDLKTNTDYTAYALEGMGSSISVSQRQAQVSQLYLEPFMTYIKDNAMTGCFTDQTPSSKSTYITNHNGLTPTVTTSGNVVTISAVQRLFAKGEYVGIKLPQATRLDSICISDSLFCNHPILWSGDGKTWNRLEDANTAPNGYVRYLVVANNLDNNVSFRLYKNDIKLFLPVKTTISGVTIPTDTEVWQSHTKNYITDGDYSTFCTLNRCQKSKDYYTVDLGSVNTIHDVRICMGTTNGDYMTEGRVQVSEDSIKWFSLRVKGVTDSFKYTLDMPQNVKYSDEMTYCDFDGRELQARYVRLYVHTPNTSKWLRLYEIEVNKNYYNQSMRQLCTDGDNNNQSAAIDGDGTTCISVNTQGPLTYYLEAQTPAKCVTVYSSPDEGKTSINAINSDGSSIELGQLTDACQTIDLSFCRDAVKIQFTYEGMAPSIYEIVPTFDTEKQYSVITEVKSIITDNQLENQSSVYDLQGRKLKSAPEHGLYIEGHKLIKK